MVGRKLSEDRLEAIRRDLVNRLPGGPASGELDPEQRFRVATDLTEATLGKEIWLEQSGAVRDRMLLAADALVEARRQDREARDHSRTQAWIDHWLLRPSEEGLMGSVAAQESLRARLLARQRDQERRDALHREGARGARVVLSPTSQNYVQGLQQALGVSTQQKVIELALAAVYAVYEPVIDHQVDQAEGLVATDDPAPALRPWKEAMDTARTRMK